MDYMRGTERKFTAKELFHYLDEKVTELERVNFISTEPEKPLIRMFADRAVVMLDGKIAASGRFEELAQSPDPRVQHFLTGTYDKNEDIPEAARKAVDPGVLLPGKR